MDPAPASHPVPALRIRGNIKKFIRRRNPQALKKRRRKVYMALRRDICGDRSPRSRE